MIIIGCPIFRRDWILPHWFKAIEKQTYPLSELGFVFIAGEDDDVTIDALFAWHRKHPEVRVFDVSVDTDHIHVEHNKGSRRWNRGRYLAMADLRNDLLSRVSCYEPDKFFSLDSDILLEDPDTIYSLDVLTDIYDAVSPLAFMSPDGVTHPNVMSWVSKPGGVAARATYELGKLFRADVIMAAKMMSRNVYRKARYQAHRQGEDLGWSTQCHLHSFELWNASQIYCPHVMSEDRLKRYLAEGDNRSKKYFAATS